MLIVKYRPPKKARQGEPPRKSMQKKLAVENIRARKNGTSPPPLKDKWYIEKVSELRKLSVRL